MFPGLNELRHYFRVADNFNFWEHEYWLALFHDTVEDEYIGKWLLEYWPALDFITRREFELYTDYIYRVKLNPTATRVKLADIEDNLNRNDGRFDLTKKARLRTRYLMARRILLDI